MYYIKHIGPEKGYGVFATQPIQSGTIILEEDPIVSCQFSWNRVYKYKACDYCLKSLETAQDMCRRLTQNQGIILPYSECCLADEGKYTSCPNCEEHYCCAQCRESAYKEYHQVLCPTSGVYDPKALKELEDTWMGFHYPPETSTIMLIVRLIARIKQEPNQEDFLNKINQFCHKSINVAEEISHKLLGNNFKEQLEVLRQQIASLMFDETLPVSHWFTVEGFQSLFALLGSNQQGIGSSSLSVWVNNCDELNLSEVERDELDKMIDRLYEELETAAGPFLNCEGSGLYLTQSKCNHSCLPNAEVCFLHNNNRLSLKAVHDIETDEEICISYLSECYSSRSRHSRQKFLRENYLFNCKCAKCLLEIDEPDITSDESDSEEEMQ